jgi:hypothetical protein
LRGEPTAVPGSHVLLVGREDVDGRNKSGHDERNDLGVERKYLENTSRGQHTIVMPGLVPGTHVLLAGNEDVGGRTKSGHDEADNAGVVP